MRAVKIIAMFSDITINCRREDINQSYQSKYHGEAVVLGLGKRAYDRRVVGLNHIKT